jgi:DNA repair exonuclease SbcCD ATPase subunit
MSGAIRFGVLSASNVGPFESISLNLRDRGLLLVLGDNRDTTAANNNGSGKSHIMKAISWCLWGETPDGDKVDKLTKNGTDHIEVALEWEDDNGLWRVTRMKARTASVKLLLEHNDQDISAPTVAATQAEIGKCLGMDFATWRNTVLYAQGDIVRFADPGTTDTERKLILKRILRLDALDRAAEAARARLRRIESDQAQLNQEAATVIAELRGLDAAGDLQAELKTAEAEAKQYELKAKKLPQLRELQAQVNETISDIRERLTEVEDARKEATQYQLEAVAAQAELNQANADKKRAEDGLAQFKSGKCPTCGSKANTPGVRAKCAELERARIAAEAAAETALSEAQAARRNAAEAAQRGEAVKREVADESAEWYATAEELRKDINAAEHALVCASASRRRAAGIRERAQDIDSKRAMLNERGREIATSSDALVEERSYIEFWVKGFSNAGVASYLMDSIMPAISERANHYLGILADGDITVQFDTQSKLKSGDTREKLSISWVIEGEADTTPSGGQRKKISIAVDLALMDLVAQRERAAVDLLLMDEMLDGLDVTGRDRVMSLLNELRQKRSTIVVISHDNDIAQMFERTLTVRKMGRRAELLGDGD